MTAFIVFLGARPYDELVDKKNKAFQRVAEKLLAKIRSQLSTVRPAFQPCNTSKKLRLIQPPYAFDGLVGLASRLSSRVLSGASPALRECLRSLV